MTNKSIANSRIEARKMMAEKYGSKAIEDKVVHHIDRNPLNNNLDNLAIMSLSAHIRLHHPRNILKEKFQTTVRLPREIWLQLRRLEEQGKIKSIHAAILKGLELIIKEFKVNDK